MIAVILKSCSCFYILRYVLSTISAQNYEPIVLEDPDDDIYLIAAMESLSRYIVSGDQHLLKMNDFSGIKIITAVDFIHSMA